MSDSGNPEPQDDELDEECPEFVWEVPSLPPEVIKGYELTERIAEGGMGAVFRGKQVSLDRTVAVKVLKPKLAKDKSFLRRFTREARAVASLNHRNVVSAIDVGESRGWHYLVMEFVDGPTLQEALDKDGKIPEKDAIRITWQICAGLRHAHKHGFVHRDVKPDNVILSSNGDAKLCDLGLAKKVESDSTVLTLLGTAMGTPLYISPEQAQGETDVDIRSDIYSTGATFYHMVCGCPPFQGNSAAVLMAKHLTQDPTPVQMRNSKVHVGTAAIIEKMLMKSPDDRYQTPNEVMADLKAVASGQWKSDAAETIDVTPLEDDDDEAAQMPNLKARRSARRRRLKRPPRRRRR